ncbi:MAG: nitroreductase [Micromonosporaceae bacterium]
MAQGQSTQDRPLAAALAQAATVARLAPSVHNTQPWRWQVEPEHLDLYAERSRQLPVVDPHGRLLLLSCGASLHHARLALMVQGWQPTVSRLPDEADPDHLARITATERIPVSPASMRLYQAAEIRHTDRRALTDTRVPPQAIETMRAAVEAEGNHLHVLRPDQIADLASAAARADAIGLADPAQRAEMSAWVGGERDQGLGVPDSVIPHTTPQTEVPLRDFGRAGTLDPGGGHDRNAVYGVLFGSGDEPPDWLRAGEALSALWLTATESGVSVLPFSSVIEVGAARERIRGMLAGVGQPYLVLRFGVADSASPGPVGTGRLAPEHVVRLPPSATGPSDQDG